MSKSTKNLKSQIRIMRKIKFGPSKLSDLLAFLLPYTHFEMCLPLYLKINNERVCST